MFRGLQSLGGPIDPPGTFTPPEDVPVGFDAVVQFDTTLLRRQLGSNLVEVRATNLSARVTYAAEGFPEAVRAAVAPLLGPFDAPLLLETDIEVRISQPRLVQLRRGTGPVAPGGLVLDSELADGPPAADPVEIEWVLELNLLRLFPETSTASARARGRGGVDEDGGPTGGGGGSTGDGGGGGGPHGGGSIEVGGTVVLDTGDGPASPPGTKEVRNRLATGRVVTLTPTNLVTRGDLLQAWVELDLAQAQTTVFGDESPLTELLAVQRGQDMLQGALAVLTSRAGLRLTPRVSIAGSVSPQQVALMQLGTMHVKELVQAIPDGRDVLSLCFNFGPAESPDAEGNAFLGSSQFGYYVSIRTLRPVVRLRWRLRPAALEFSGDTPVELPLHEGATETGQGRARLRLRLAKELRLLGLMAVEGTAGHVQDDVLRLGCDQEIQLLKLWRPDGREVEDLGDLAEPMTLPFVVNNQIFASPSADEPTDTPFRKFLEFVMAPLARPLLDPIEIMGLSGLASEALGAIVVRWSQVVRVPPDSGGGVGAGGASTL